MSIPRLILFSSESREDDKGSLFNEESFVKDYAPDLIDFTVNLGKTPITDKI